MFGLFEYNNSGGFPCGFRMDEVTGYATRHAKNGYGESIFDELLVYLRSDSSPFVLREANSRIFIKEYKEWYAAMFLLHSPFDKK